MTSPVVIVLLCLRRDSGTNGCIVIHGMCDRAVAEIRCQTCLQSIAAGLPSFFARLCESEKITFRPGMDAEDTVREESYAFSPGCFRSVPLPKKSTLLEYNTRADLYIDPPASSAIRTRMQPELRLLTQRDIGVRLRPEPQALGGGWAEQRDVPSGKNSGERLNRQVLRSHSRSSRFPGETKTARSNQWSDVTSVRNFPQSRNEG